VTARLKACKTILTFHKFEGLILDFGHHISRQKLFMTFAIQTIDRIEKIIDKIRSISSCKMRRMAIPAELSIDRFHSIHDRSLDEIH
jgi:hypothetical protein